MNEKTLNWVAALAGVCIGALIFGTLRQKNGMVHITNVLPGVDVKGNGKTEVYTADEEGVMGDFVGYLVACPQTCVPKGSHQSLSVYPTKQTMKALYLTQNASDFKAALKALGNAANNDSGVSGCAHVAQKVPIYNMVQQGGHWMSNLLNPVGSLANSPTYYTLVTYGSLSGGKYIASEVWISDTQWDPYSTRTMIDIYSDIRSNRNIAASANEC